MRGQDANNWDEGSTTDGGCVFTGQAYHTSIQLPSSYETCFAEATNFTDFAFQAEMTVLKGDGGALLFRAGNGNDPNGYRFFVGRDFYNLDYGAKELIRTSTSFKANLNQSYLLTVIVRGRSISVYVDKHWLGSVEDSSAHSGKIGFAASDFTNKAEVVFRNVQVWVL